MQDKPWVWEIPEYFNIGSACTRPVDFARVKDKQAIIVEDEKRGCTSMTYAELDHASNQFASALQAMGVAPGAHVLIRLPNTLAFPIAFFGTLKTGAVAVPASTLLSSNEVEYLVCDAQAKVVVTAEPLCADLPDSHLIEHIIVTEAPTSHTFDTLQHPAFHNFETLLKRHPPLTAAYQTRAEDSAYLVYTSGTSGHPKGVLHAHRALLGRTPANTYWFDFNAHDERILHAGKFNWTYVLGTALMDPLYRSKTVVVYEGKNDPATWPRLIAKHHCSVFIGVPTIYRQIIHKTEFCGKDVPTLRHCMSAGEHLSNEIMLAWRERFQQDIFEAIGMSECSYYISQSTSFPIRPGSAGFAQPGHEIQLLDAEMNPVEDNQEGMICIPLNDPGLFLKYWRLDEETHATRNSGFFLTGDYAQRDKDGYIWFLGRKDDIINSFGYRISPHEVERVLKTHPAIDDCIVVEESIDENKRIVSACVILHPDIMVRAETLSDFAKQHLAIYKVPRKVHFMRDFPRTRNGKVLRKKVREML